MNLLSQTLLDVVKDIAKVPKFYAGTPEEADGMIVAIASVILHEASNEPFGKCMRQVTALIRESMEGVYPSDVIVPHLGDESFPDRNPSFAAFRRNATSFIDLFEKRLQSPTTCNDN